jgi:hypothetical protein
MFISVLIGITVCAALVAIYLASRTVLKVLLDMETAAGDEAVGDSMDATNANPQPQAKLTVYRMRRRFSTLVNHR